MTLLFMRWRSVQRVFRDSLKLVRCPRRRVGAKTNTCSKRRDRKTKVVFRVGSIVKRRRDAAGARHTPELTLVRVADKEALDKYATAARAM